MEHILEVFMKKIIYLFLLIIGIAGIYTLIDARQLKKSHYLLEQDMLTVNLTIEHQNNKLVTYTAITDIEFSEDARDEMLASAEATVDQFSGYSGVTMSSEIEDNHMITTQTLIFDEMVASELADEPNLANFTNGVLSFGQLEQALFQQGFQPTKE